MRRPRFAAKTIWTSRLASRCGRQTAQLVAWVEIGTAAPPASSTLVTSRPDGSSRREVVVDTGTFFLQWDPTSSRLAYLGSFRGTVGMGVADTGADGGPVAKTLGVGQPFYLSWATRGRPALDPRRHGHARDARPHGGAPRADRGTARRVPRARVAGGRAIRVRGARRRRAAVGRARATAGRESSSDSGVRSSSWSARMAAGSPTGWTRAKASARYR